MTTHLFKPGPVDNLAMRCGLRVGQTTSDDFMGSEDNIRAVDCVKCLHDLIVEMRVESMGGQSDAAGLWLAGGDTGTSSITIWSVMTGRQMPVGRHPDVPHDPSDFERCHNLLQEFPEWRDRLPEVAEAHVEWRGLVDIWGELTALYLEELPSGRAPRLSARMKEVSP